MNLVHCCRCCSMWALALMYGASGDRFGQGPVTTVKGWPGRNSGRQVGRMDQSEAGNAATADWPFPDLYVARLRFGI